MSPFVQQVVQFVLTLVGEALDGDEGADAKLRDFLPEELYTQAIAQKQDALDEAKFGSRND